MPHPVEKERVDARASVELCYTGKKLPLYQDDTYTDVFALLSQRTEHPGVLGHKVAMGTEIGPEPTTHGQRV